MRVEAGGWHVLPELPAQNAGQPDTDMDTDTDSQIAGPRPG
jgi:hypothetical protein